MSKETETLLFDVCSSVCCCRAPSIEPLVCTTILLAKCRSREGALVQLSAIRCLYSIKRDSTGEFREFSLQVLESFLHNLHILYSLLSRYLDSCDQFVSFSASKALVSLMLWTGIKELWVEDLFTKLQSHTDHSVYCMQTIREFLKISRKTHGKSITQLSGIDHNRECLRIISERKYWELTLQLFIKQKSRFSVIGQQQTLVEFLSLTTEFLRHSSDHSLSEHEAGCLQQSIASEVPGIFQLVLRSSSSILVVKRFIDLLLKIQSVIGTCYSIITPILKQLLDLHMTKSILHWWLVKHAETFQFKPITISPPFFLQIISNGLLDVFIRKTALLVLEVVAGLLNSISDQPSDDHDRLCRELSDVLRSVRDLMLSCGVQEESNTTHWKYTKVLHQVMSDEDGCLVRCLQACMSTLKITTKNAPLLELVPGLKNFVAVSDAHSLWLCFLASTGFDHSVLLDLILTPEINFSSVLSEYLKLVASNWEYFQSRVSVASKHLELDFPEEDTSGPCMASNLDSSESEDAMQIPEVDSVATLGISCSDLEALQIERDQHTKMNLVDYSSSSDSEEEGRGGGKEGGEVGEAVNLCSNDMATLDSQGRKRFIDKNSSTDRTRESVSSSSPIISPASKAKLFLEKVMSCIIRLRMSLERMTESQLIHKDSNHLISSIETVEELFESL